MGWRQKERLESRAALKPLDDWSEACMGHILSLNLKQFEALPESARLTVAKLRTVVELAITWQDLSHGMKLPKMLVYIAPPEVSR